MRGVEVQGADIDALWLFDGERFLRVNGVDVIATPTATWHSRAKAAAMVKTCTYAYSYSGAPNAVIWGPSSTHRDSSVPRAHTPGPRPSTMAGVRVSAEVSFYSAISSPSATPACRYPSRGG